MKTSQTMRKVAAMKRYVKSMLTFGLAHWSLNFFLKI